MTTKSCNPRPTTDNKSASLTISNLDQNNTI